MRCFTRRRSLVLHMFSLRVLPGKRNSMLLRDAVLIDSDIRKSVMQGSFLPSHIPSCSSFTSPHSYFCFSLLCCVCFCSSSVSFPYHILFSLSLPLNMLLFCFHPIISSFILVLFQFCSLLSRFLCLAPVYVLFLLFSTFSSPFVPLAPLFFTLKSLLSFLF